MLCLRRLGEKPAGGRRARRPALGRRRDARLHGPPARGEPRHAAAQPHHDATDRLEQPVEWLEGGVDHRRLELKPLDEELSERARRRAAAADGRRAAVAARGDHGGRRGQPVLHGGAGQDADRRRRDRDRPRALARAARQAARRARAVVAHRRVAGASRRAAAARAQRPADMQRSSAMCSGIRRSPRSTPPTSTCSRHSCANTSSCGATAATAAASTRSSIICCIR